MDQTPTPAPSNAPLAEVMPGSIYHELKLSKDAEDWFKTLSPGLFDNYKSIEGTWNHPMTQFTVTLVRDVEFRQAVSQIYQKQNTAFIGYEIGWIILIWTFRAWRLSKVSTWLTRLWTQAYISVIFWAGLLLLVPYLVWGDSYKLVLSHLVRAVIKHFF